MFEEDTAEGAVYVPDSADLPLSRRPRMQFELARDGSARLYFPGPGDRPEPRAATWHEEGDVLVIEAGAGGPGPAELRVVERASGRLVVRTR